MGELNVRIVTLDHTLVASAYGFGESPEGIAHEKLFAWAKSQELMDDLSGRRFFGFNSPSPSPGNPNYGYELVMTVEAGVEPAGDIRINELYGGLYAVTSCETVIKITEMWQSLYHWLEGSDYKHAHHQWFEELLNPFETDVMKYKFDLHLPIME